MEVCQEMLLEMREEMLRTFLRILATLHRMLFPQEKLDLTLTLKGLS